MEQGQSIFKIEYFWFIFSMGCLSNWKDRYSNPFTVSSLIKSFISFELKIDSNFSEKLKIDLIVEFFDSTEEEE